MCDLGDQAVDPMWNTPDINGTKDFPPTMLVNRRVSERGSVQRADRISGKPLSEGDFDQRREALRLPSIRRPTSYLTISAAATGAIW